MNNYIDPEVEMMQRLHEAFINSYDVIVNNKNPYEFIQSEGDVVFAHNIDKVINLKQLHYMLGYWEKEEEYERCAELKKVIDEFTRLSTRHM